MPEIGYNDGSYLTQKGNDLIAKLMASGEGLQFTRVSVGDGSIPCRPPRGGRGLKLLHRLARPPETQEEARV